MHVCSSRFSPCKHARAVHPQCCRFCLNNIFASVSHLIGSGEQLAGCKLYKGPVVLVVPGKCGQLQFTVVIHTENRSGADNKLTVAVLIGFYARPFGDDITHPGFQPARFIDRTYKDLTNHKHNLCGLSLGQHNLGGNSLSTPISKRQQNHDKHEQHDELLDLHTTSLYQSK